MSLNYGVLKTASLFLDSFQYGFFKTLLISIILLILLLIINKKRKLHNYIFIGVNIILILLVLYFYINDIFTFKYSNPINNMYFYFLNTIIYLILSIVIALKKNLSIFEYILHGVLVLFIGFSLFMTVYLKNNNLLVIGNIFPMIKFGNIIYIIYYIYTIIVLNIKFRET